MSQRLKWLLLIYCLLVFAGSAFTLLALGNARVLGKALIMAKSDGLTAMVIAIVAMALSLTVAIIVATRKAHQRHG